MLGPVAQKPMRLKSLVRAVAALSIALYLVLAFGASLYGSYRHEPSGVQYVFLPAIAAPVVLVLAIMLASAGSGAGTSIGFRLLPFVGALILFLPAVGLPLADTALEFGRWATILAGVAHALLLIAFLRREWSTAPVPPPA